MNIRTLLSRITYLSLFRRLCPYWWLPWGPYIQPRWPVTRKIIELEIVHVCNLSCLNCECCFADAPDATCMMDPAQIKKFVDESIALAWKWERIKIRGGEPTLHPLLPQIIKNLEVYKKYNPPCQIELLTNGFSDKVNEVLAGIPEWVVILNSKKDLESVKCAAAWKHDSINLAPVDFAVYAFADFTKGCWRAADCGMALSKYGYYPCAAGIHVSRIFGFDIGVKKLAMVNNDSMTRSLSVLCKYCGHFKQPNDIPGTHTVSSSWKKAFDDYKRARPKMSLYE
jgi:hypothetical protein